MSEAKCELCGEPMPPGEDMFKFHGYSGTCPKPPVPRQPETTIELVAHLHRQRAFSEQTFGPGTRTAGVVDHIRKELREIEANPHDLSEWIDVVILGFDGAWRAGFTPEQIVEALVAKQTKNESRTWPDWRTASPDKAIEHVRNDEASGFASQHRPDSQGKP